MKITYKSGEEPPALPDDIKVNVTAAGVESISTDTAETVSVDGNVANATSVTNKTTIAIDGNGASGRDTIDSKSDMPTYIWVLIAVIIAAVFLIIWMASKRGVFTRRK